MQPITETLDRLYNVSRTPFSLIDSSGALLQAWPEENSVTLLEGASLRVLEDFRARGCDERRPLVVFIDPGFLLGVVQTPNGHFVLIGLVSPYHHSHADVLKMARTAIHPTNLQRFVDGLVNQNPSSLESVKDLICLLAGLCDQAVAPQDILFVDDVTEKKLSRLARQQPLFEQDAVNELHVPIDFETAICSAVEAGNRVLLEHSLFAPRRGRVGRMSPNELRQAKYEFVSLTVLISRAAIRGGLDAETSFGISDLYCQRADNLVETVLVQNLTFTMLMDFCEKVHEARKQPRTSPVIGMCLDYISAHLHESINLEQLSQHCGMCSRSLSLHFRQEVGMGITEYIHREKLEEADYLLLHTDYSLADISSFLNYPSQSYFNLVFKKYRGTTPQRFRNSR